VIGPAQLQSIGRGEALRRVAAHGWLERCKVGGATELVFSDLADAVNILDRLG
jgi:hypothetical protein